MTAKNLSGGWISHIAAHRCFTACNAEVQDGRIARRVWTQEMCHG